MRFDETLRLQLDIKKEAIWIKTDQEKEVTAVVLNILKEEGIDTVFDFEPSSGLYELSIKDDEIAKTFLDNKNYPGVKNGASGQAVLSLFNKNELFNLTSSIYLIL